MSARVKRSRGAQALRGKPFFFRRLQLRGQLFVSCTLLMFLWLAIFAFDSVKRVESMVGDQVSMSQEANLTQTSAQLTYHMEEMERLSEILLLNHVFQEQTPYFATRSVPVSQLLEEANHYFRQKELLENVQRTYATYDIRVYLSDDMLYAREGRSFFPESDVSTQGWYQRLPTGRSTSDWVTLNAKLDEGSHSPTHERRFTLARRLTINGQSDSIGVLTVSMFPSTLQDMLVSSFGELGGSLYLLDGSGLCVASSAGAAHLTNSIAKAALSSEAETLSTPSGSMIARHSALKDSDYTLLSLVPLTIIQHAGEGMLNASLVTLVLLALATLVLINFLSNRLSYRIHALARSMTDVGGGAFSTEVRVHADDEIGLIENKLNAMSQQLSRLVAEIHVSERRKRAAELRALQAQINPHFLYNTLDTINWMAMEYGATDISSIAVALGNFFRQSLSGGEDVITLEEEMALTRLYVEIQQTRMGNKLNITYDIPDDVLPLKTIKLLIQPLVENAVKHGFGGLCEQSGHIHISAERAQEMLIVRVLNDGIGLTDESSAHRHAHSGYGLKNIVERLKLHFGEESELTIQPGKDGIGVIVQIIWRAQ